MSVVDLQAGAVTQRVHGRRGARRRDRLARRQGRLRDLRGRQQRRGRRHRRRSPQTRPRSWSASGRDRSRSRPDGKTLFVTGENAAVDLGRRRRDAHRRRRRSRLPKADAAPTPPRPMGAVLSPDAHAALRLERPGPTRRRSSTSRQRTLVRTIERRRPAALGHRHQRRRRASCSRPTARPATSRSSTSRAGTVERRISLGGSPWGIAVAPAPLDGRSTMPMPCARRHLDRCDLHARSASSSLSRRQPAPPRRCSCRGSTARRRRRESPGRRRDA